MRKQEKEIKAIQTEKQFTDEVTVNKNNFLKLQMTYQNK